jgi:FAD/FMN-containing dehydrogenase
MPRGAADVLSGCPGKQFLISLKLMVGEDGIEDMKALRAVFDPNGVLNPGNLF